MRAAPTKTFRACGVKTARRGRTWTRAPYPGKRTQRSSSEDAPPFGDDAGAGACPVGPGS
eukprot:8707898-Lingulodinium_polyedra.AAC.1